jgi:hypothetical protein
MENQELTLTEEELKKKIDEAVKKATDELSTKLAKEHNEQMAQQRIKAKDDQDKAVAKAVAEANLSAEEKAKKEIEEQRKLEQEELAQLRLEKKINDRAKKLADNELPDFFKNDTRLLNAEEDKVDEVIKTIKEEYSKVLPKGATTSTNINATTPSGTKSKEEQELERLRNLGRGKSFV